MKPFVELEQFIIALGIHIHKTSCPPKSDNFLVDMRCKSYCNGPNFRGYKFSRIPVKFAKVNTRKVFFEKQLKKIDAAKKTWKVNDSQNSPTKKEKRNFIPT